MSKDRIKELVNLLNIYRDSYYNQNKSVVSDKEYDELFDELVELEKECGRIYANSPTQTVGYKVVSSLKKVKHNHPLLSLDKTTEISDLIKFFGERTAVIMAKMDGLTCSIRYNNGVLVSAESRGNGEIGEDITHNVLTFVNIPKEIPFKGELIVDGEAIIDHKTFKKIKENEKTDYKNARNLVSGSVRQLNSEIAARRNIRFIAWKLYSMSYQGKDLTDNSFAKNLEALDELGFEIVPVAVVNNVKMGADMAIATVRMMCEINSYPIDGIVATFNDVSYGDSLGATGHHPRNSIAYKFYQEEVETRLLDIEWQTTRTGLINPVAILEPVEIDGTTVSRASLSNVSVIKDLELGIGDMVSVIKANQIIPKIIDNNTRSNTYKIPSVCPACNCKVAIKNENGRKMLMCTNHNCIARLLDKICNFTSRQGMNINGLSKERLKIFINKGYISSFDDIYKLHEKSKEIEKIDGFGKSSVNKLINAIEDSKRCSAINFLTAIGITSIGKSGSKAIVNHLKSCRINSCDKENEKIIDMFLNRCLCDYNWSVIDDFGLLTSKYINDFCKENESEIAATAKYLIFDEDEKDDIVDDKLLGKTFCITGKLLQFPNRDAIVSEIERHGGKVVKGVTNKTNYLITNNKNSGSSKNKQAIKFGIKVISELEFIELCK